MQPSSRAGRKLPRGILATMTEAAADTADAWYEIRPAVPADLGTSSRGGFVVETTVRVLRPRGVAEAVWMRVTLGAQWVAIVDSRCVIAEADGVIVGFAWCDEAGALGMVYVKRDFRGERIGLRLIWALGLESPIAALNTTASFRAWCRRHQITARVV